MNARRAVVVGAGGAMNRVVFTPAPSVCVPRSIGLAVVVVLVILTRDAPAGTLTNADALPAATLVIVGVPSAGGGVAGAVTNTSTAVAFAVALKTRNPACPAAGVKSFASVSKLIVVPVPGNAINVDG